jgi:hypothetical protein
MPDCSAKPEERSIWCMSDPPRNGCSAPAGASTLKADPFVRKACAREVRFLPFAMRDHHFVNPK